MRIADRLQAMAMHATARWTVRYGEELRFAGSELPDPEVVRVDTRHGPVPVHVYGSGTDGGTAAHVHLHGGAWLMRFPQMDDWWCRYLAATTGAVVHNVDFRTGPYVAYPVAQEQAHDVASWVAHRFGRTSVGGFSSGGGMAAAVALMARDRGSFTPALQVLGIPALDMASEVPAAAGMISPSLRGLVRRVYFPDVARRREPYASPLLAPDLTGLPPALVLTAGRDTLRPDGVRYAQRLREAGVDVWHHDTPGVDHYFLTEDPVRARDTMAQVADRVRSALAG
ncbi:alpha/beta hydrolase fold domain-containing protein [Klenkia sp. LSe6-5]|uniref:Alpha/beta hydrolase fold domain-containing protein n=1 Tax=Klenkia sesuvii TaxID=3103137 RepID=A0ABU8DS34_9ACTN